MSFPNSSFQMDDPSSFLAVKCATAALPIPITIILVLEKGGWMDGLPF